MTSLRHPKAESPFKCLRRHESFHFWLRSDLDDGRAEALMEAVAKATRTDDADVFKTDGQRLVFRPKDDPQALVKINRLPRLKDRIRAWANMPAEITAHLEAAQKGIDCPMLLGYFEQRATGFSMPTLNGLCLEFLEGWHELQNQEYPSAVTALKQLFEKGINHPDFMRKNVMASEEHHGKVKIIDFEGASFVGERNIRALLMQTQRFVEFNELGPEHTLNADFISMAAHIAPEYITTEVFEAAVRKLLRRHRSRAERRELIMPDIMPLLNANRPTAANPSA